MRRLAVLVLALLLPAGGPGAAERVALVIGNGAYRHATELPNPPRDAAAVAAALRRVGFEVFEGIDLDREATTALLRRFVRALDGAATGLVFYAGHGLQVGGENWLLPVDAELAHESDLAFEAVALGRLLGQIEAPGRTTIVVLDACRNNPLARSFRRRARSADVGEGLARVTASTGAFVAYATAPGDVALDGEGEHSPFTAAFLMHLETPGLEINQLMVRVRAEVFAKTDRDQLPWSSSALLGEFWFVPPAAAPPPAVALPTAPAPEPPAIDYPPVGPDETYAHVSTFARAAPSPLDGIWKADWNGGRYRIDAGRVWNLTPYRHLLLFPVEAGDVVVRDLVRSAPGVLAGYDMVAAGPWTGRLQADGTLAVEVATAVGPFTTVLRPQELDDPRAHRRELAALR